jgi:nucleotide-binding universal stress UspA family protein
MTQATVLDAAAPSQLIVISTLSTGSNNAARRAALVAREKGWVLRILHVQRDARLVPAAQVAVEQLCTQLQDRLSIAATSEVMSGDVVDAVARQTQAADLLVIGSSRDNALEQKIDGASMERLIRLSRVPTLVVKRQVDAAFAQGASSAGSRSRSGYRRVLACVDLEPTAAAAVAAAAAIAPAGEVEAFHAVSARASRLALSGVEQPGHPAVLGHALSSLRQLLASERSGSSAFVGFGHPPDAILARERALGAELVVIGKRRRGLIADLFLGEVTRHVLAGSSADVLVLPRTPESMRTGRERKS